MNNILKLSEYFYKLSQQFLSQEKGVYGDILEKSNIWFDDSPIYTLLDKYDINKVSLSVIIYPNLNVKINVIGKHPKLQLFTNDINKTIGSKMSSALKTAASNKKIIPPESNITLEWKTNFGYQ